MKSPLYLLILLVSCGTPPEKDLTGTALLDKCIAYHDPQGKWAQAEMKLIFVEIDTTRADLRREVAFSNRTDFFHYLELDSEKKIELKLKKDTCNVLLNDKADFSAEEAENYHLNCDYAKTLKDYYLYLYGLPMKLKDPGTMVNEQVIEEMVNGKNYYSLKVTYNEAVGSDIWNFFIDKETYALEGYRFYHEEGKIQGENIALKGMIEFDGMKIPKARHWFLNKDNSYLATDDLLTIEVLN